MRWPRRSVAFESVPFLARRVDNMAAERYVIVAYGDDFGQSPGVNRGIIQGFEQGL